MEVERVTMDISGAREFINENRDQILDLFLTYQMIEIMLFLKLHLPDVPKVEGREAVMDDLNKGLNSKTFGKLLAKYLAKHPDDKHDLKSDLKTVGNQRNSFMHSIWITLALCEGKEKIREMGELSLRDFSRNANRLLDKVNALPA